MMTADKFYYIQTYDYPESTTIELMQAYAKHCLSEQWHQFPEEEPKKAGQHLCFLGFDSNGEKVYQVLIWTGITWDSAETVQAWQEIRGPK